MKQYFILIRPDFYPRGPGYLGAIISRHHTMEAALKAQERVHKQAYVPITTAVWSNHFMPSTQEYLAVAYGNPTRKPIHVRTILNHCK